MANNEQNLIPNSERTKEEREKIARAGGIASGQARREKKAMREWAEMFRDMPIQVVAPDGQKIDTTFGGAIVYQQMQNAITKKNVKSAKFVADLLGEMTQTINVKDITPQVIVGNPDTAKKVKDIIDGNNEDI